MSESPQRPRSSAAQRDTNYSEMTFMQTVKKKSTFQKVVFILAILFFITTIIFIILFGVYFTKANKSESAQLPETRKVCSTSECVKAADMLIRKMNMNAKPCEDFSEYACGNFIKTTVLPEGATQVDPFDVLKDENNLKMKDIITEDIKEEDPKYLKDMKKLYISCMDEATIETKGVDSFQNDLTLKALWPTLYSKYDESKKISDLVDEYALDFSWPLFTCSVGPHMKNSLKNVIYIDEPEFGLSQEYFNRPRNDNAIKAYEKYLIETAVLLGGWRNTSENDVKNVVNLEIELSKIMVPLADKQNISSLYYPLPLNQLPTNEFMNISSALYKTYQKATGKVLQDQEVIVSGIYYISRLHNVLKEQKDRTIRNYLGFKRALSKIGGLTRKLRDIRLELDKEISGKKADKPRWEYCLSFSASAFWKVMGLKFITGAFPKSDIDKVEHMVDKVRAEFTEMIKGISWMGQSTKDEAIKKLKFIQQKVAYPTVGFSEVDIANEYKEYSMTDDFYANRLQITQLNYFKTMRELDKNPVNKKEWHDAPFEVNAFYSPEKNDIVLPAGILQPPFFSPTFHVSINYGALGSVIGTIIIFGFDYGGSQYDENGNLRNWFQETDRRKFDEKTQCIVHQNDATTVPEISKKLNGKKTKGSAVADSDALRLSFRTYKNVTKNVEFQSLPGLDLNQDQLFFLSFAQVLCQKMTIKYLDRLVETGGFLPGKYRILQPLQNSEDFAKTFNCPSGSPMNPAKKCSIW